MNKQARQSRDHVDELIDEAGRESFPASDPPAFASGARDIESSGASGDAAAGEHEDKATGKTVPPRLSKATEKQNDRSPR